MLQSTLATLFLLVHFCSLVLSLPHTHQDIGHHAHGILHGANLCLNEQFRSVYALSQNSRTYVDTGQRTVSMTTPSRRLPRPGLQFQVSNRRVRPKIPSSPGTFSKDV